MKAVHSKHARSRGPARLALVLFLAFLAVGAVFLVGEHRMHALGWLPHLLLVVCIALLYLSDRLDKQPFDNPQEPPKS